MYKNLTAEFKIGAAKLVVDHDPTYVKVAESSNVSRSRWVNKLYK